MNGEDSLEAPTRRSVRRTLLAALAPALLLVPAAPAMSAAGGQNACLAETHATGWGGGGGPATAARLAAPGSIVPLPNGDLAISDTLNGAVRIVGADGTMRTLALLTKRFGR